MEQYRKQVVKTEKTLTRQQKERIRREKETAQRCRHEKRIQARDEKVFQKVKTQHQRRLKDIQARKERVKEEQTKLTEQQVKQAQRAHQEKQNKRAELTRQQKQEAIARDKKKLVKKQSSKSKSRKGPEIAARSYDEIYSVQIAATLQHQHNVDDVRCTGLPANYESCDETFFPASY